MGTARTRRHSATGFALRAAAWSLGLFGVLRLDPVEAHALLPLTQLQARLAIRLCGESTMPVEATLACSAADALALCAGAILAFPASWRMRLAGAGAGVALILGLNTLRIGTLGRAAASPAWFAALHVYIWPAILTIAIAGYVFTWMRHADAPAWRRAASDLRVEDRRPAGITSRFVLFTLGLLLLFTAASPLYLDSGRVLAVSAFVARTGASLLRLFGVEATAAANVLQTPRGAFMVTQECISSPLIPVYLAAVLVYATTWHGRAVGVAATLPIFVGLGVARLLVVALPAAVVSSPIFLVHAFSQLVLAVVVVGFAAWWRHGAGGTAVRRTVLGVTVGLAAGVVTTRLAPGIAAAAPLGDPQGAIALLPGFQIGLYVALWSAAFVALGWRRFLVGFALLALTQAVAVAMVNVLGITLGIAPHVRDVRAWAVAGPLIVLALVHVNVGRWRRPGSGYRRFWEDVGDRFPDLDGAVSTRYYAENERRLFAEHFPPLEGLTILKTDLWDEAKNTRILAWASRQGAHAYGVDISAPTVMQAQAAFDRRPRHLRSAVADTRALPFRDASFDAVYSMGTIEHFAETERAVEDMARVLKPGGCAIVGVPNRHDPFLRPMLAAALQAVGLYAYGYEKSFSRRALREMLERAGLQVTAETAILFIPGWLRMLDLACQSWCRPLATVTGALVWPFIFLDRHVPAVRRYGYLLATVATKPAQHLESSHH